VSAVDEGPRDEGPTAPVELDRGTGLTCDDSAPACTFDLSGGGADSAVGTVSGQSGVTLTVGGAVSASAGEWTARGAYRCSADGALRVSIGTEVLDVPVDCV
jgi:hypothetical protein